MKYLINALASHEVHVARWYIRRGAYVAAANRAQYALKNYPEAPAQQEALQIMIQAYDALGMKDLRDDAQRILRKNFPSATRRGAPSLSWAAERLRAPCRGRLEEPHRLAQLARELHRRQAREDALAVGLAEQLGSQMTSTPRSVSSRISLPAPCLSAIAACGS